jgi:hypothetical protein
MCPDEPIIAKILSLLHPQVVAMILGVATWVIIFDMLWEFRLVQVMSAADYTINEVNIVLSTTNNQI